MVGAMRTDTTAISIGPSPPPVLRLALRRRQARKKYLAALIVPQFPRMRASALFGRRPPERAERGLTARVDLILERARATGKINDPVLRQEIAKVLAIRRPHKSSPKDRMGLVLSP